MMKWQICWAYPRVCGATVQLDDGRKAWGGLSPRVRGNPVAGANPDGKSGPIPACAGQPNQGAGRVIAGRAYPRVCGATGFGSGEIEPA